MSIQALQAQVQDAGVYQIHKKTEAQAAEQSASQQNVNVQEVPAQTDEYDKANPVGQEAEGVYSVSYDEDGNMKVDYKQPSSGAQASGEGAQAGQSGGAGAAGAAQDTSSTDDDETEKEIEKLKKQRDQIKQQLNKAQDEDTKKALRSQLQAIEAQIAQKTAQLNS